LSADPKRCRKETAPSRGRATLGLSPARVGPDRSVDDIGVGQIAGDSPDRLLRYVLRASLRALRSDCGDKSELLDSRGTGRGSRIYRIYFESALKLVREG
jgi:hypothetical protein